MIFKLFIVTNFILLLFLIQPVSLIRLSLKLLAQIKNFIYTLGTYTTLYIKYLICAKIPDDGLISESGWL